MTDITNLSAIDLLSLYKNRDLSPVEATKAALEQISTYNSQVNAFVIIDEETALAQARASLNRWLNGNPQGLVDGIPFTVKDLLLTKGLPTRKGSKAIAPNQPWEEDAPAVARLREQGGFTNNGLPVGMQIVGGKYRDITVLQAARAYETVSPFTMPLIPNKNIRQ